jgi:hypothetical protein
MEPSINVPKYHVSKNVDKTKLFTIVLFLVEKSPAKLNCLLTFMSTRWRTGKSGLLVYPSVVCHEGVK